MAVLKKKIKEIICTDLTSASTSTSIQEVLRLMSAGPVSYVLAIGPDGQPQGIFTERTALRLAALRGTGFKQKRLGELMSSPVITLGQDEYLYESFNIFGHSNIRHIVAVDDSGRVSGVVTQSSLIKNLGLEFFPSVKDVSRIMSKIVFCVPPSIKLADALTDMADKNLSCLVVSEGSKPLGIFSERDATRILAEREDCMELELGELMQKGIISVRRTDPAIKVVELMLSRGVRRIVVLDEHGDIAGISTQSNLIKHLELKYNEMLREMLREKDAELGSANRALHEKSLYLDSILRSSIDVGIVATDNNYRVTYYNPAAENMCGLASHKVLGRSLLEIHAAQGLGLDKFGEVMDIVRSCGAHVFEIHSRSGGRILAARASCILDEDKQSVGFVLTMNDVTERRKYEETIKHLAYHDPLTGLPNRMLFNDRLQMELAKAKREGRKVGLLSLDLDLFKEINDSLGHQAGDILLQSLAVRLSKLLRASDTLARMGGDEFLVIVPGINAPEDASRLAKRMACAVEKPFRIENRDVSVTASLGLAIYPEHGTDMDELLRMADMAMYKAKNSRTEKIKSCICQAY